MSDDGLLEYLKGRTDLLAKVELAGPQGQRDSRRSKKLSEVAGFCKIVLRYVRRWLANRDPLRVVEFSCGKSYLGIILAVLLEELEGKRARLVGVDVNERLTEKCARLAADVGLQHAEYVATRTLSFESNKEFDLALALHACDTATDEAIAKAIELDAELILTVPCCQNQIRAQLKAGHPLTGMTEFGPLRYRLANMLTDVLRAQFLHAAGYQVEMDEIGSPRLTPKNLCICARKVRRRSRGARDEDYVALRDFFGVKPKIEQFCPGVVREPGD